MAETRAQVMNAVLAIIQGMSFSPLINNQSSWVTTGLRLRLWGDVPTDQQPAAFLVTHREIDERRGLGLLRRRLELGVWCYCRTDDTSVNGQTLLDAIMESFEAAFGIPDDFSTGENTLGSLVYWCRIEGRVFKDPGDVDNQAMMIVPIVVEMP